MRTAITILLLLLVAGVGGFIVLRERQMPSTTELERRAGRLFELEPAEVVSLELKTPRLAVVLARGGRRGDADGVVGSDWTAHGDVEDRVDPQWVGGLLEALSSPEVIAELGGQSPGGERTASFDSAAAGFGANNVGSIVVSRRDGRVDAFEIGAAGALAGTVHLRRQGTAGPVFLVRSPLRDFTHGDPERIRDRRLWVGDPEEILGFVHQGRQGEVAFRRQSPDAYWRLERPLQTEASDATVQRLLDLLAGVRVEGFPEEVRELAADDGFEGEVISLELPGDGVPEMAPLVIRFWREGVGNGAGGEAGETAELTRQVYASCSDRAVVMAVDARVWDALDYEVDDFRNRTLARIDPEAVAAVQIATDGAIRVQLEKLGQRWMLERGGLRYRANGERVERLIETINAAEILDFVANSASSLEEFGLDEPFLSLTLAGGSGVPGETLDFGTGEDAIHARWRGDPFIFRVSAELVGEIPVETAKWKHLTVLQFAIFSLRSLQVSPGGAPPVELSYDYEHARWMGMRAGEDISELIDPARAEMLASEIGSLVAVDWLGDSAVGFAALRSPELVVDVSLQPPPGAPVAAGGGLLELRLAFAPAGTSGMDSRYYYGAVKGVPEVFLVRREWIALIATPPLKE